MISHKHPGDSVSPPHTQKTVVVMDSNKHKTGINKSNQMLAFYPF
jgi:hypothetical protein